MFGGLRGGGFLRLQQAQVGGLNSLAGFAGVRRGGLGGAMGFAQSAVSGHFGRGRHFLMSTIGQAGAASIPVAPSGASPAQVTASASTTITSAAPVTVSSAGTGTAVTLVSMPPTGDAQTSTSPVVTSGGVVQSLAAVAAPGQNQEVVTAGQAAAGSVPVLLSGMAGQGLTGQVEVTGGWGQAAAGKTTTSGTTSPTTIDPATVQKDFQKLGTDLQAIHDKSQVTPALLAAVRKDVQGLQKESTSAPTEASLSTLKNDLLALNGATPDFTQGQLQSDLEAAIKSAGVNDPALVSTLEHDLNAVATAMNITPADVQTIQADQKTIATDLGSTAPADPTNGPVAGLELPLLADLMGGRRDLGPELIGGGEALSAFAGAGQFLTTSGQVPGPVGPIMLMRGVQGQVSSSQPGAMPMAISGQAGSVQGVPFMQGPQGGPWLI
jgi:hypothetical protein